MVDLSLTHELEFTDREVVRPRRETPVIGRMWFAGFRETGVWSLRSIERWSGLGVESREGDATEDHVEHGDHTDERAQKNQEDLHSDAVPEHERILCSLPPVGARVGSIARERSRAFSEAPADVPGIEIGTDEKAGGKDRSDDVVSRGDRKHVELSHARWRAGRDRMGSTIGVSQRPHSEFRPRHVFHPPP